VRQRPEFYFGVRKGDPALPGRVLWLVVQDALRDDPVGPVLHVQVDIESDLAFTVRDDGPGLSTEVFSVGEISEPWMRLAVATLPWAGTERGIGLCAVRAPQQRDGCRCLAR